MKDNITTFYHIVPKGDGCSYLAKDENGNHFIVKKEGGINVSLIFRRFDAAQDYIDTHLDSYYMPEAIGINEKYLDIK